MNCGRGDLISDTFFSLSQFIPLWPVMARPVLRSWLVAAVAGVASIARGEDPAAPLAGELPPPPPAPLSAPAPADAGWEEQLASLHARVAELEAERDRTDVEVTPKAVAVAGIPTVNWAGQLQADFYAFNQDAASVANYGDIENGEAFRRARLGAFGDYGPSEYRIEMDFALVGRPSFLDVWAGLKDVPGLGRLRVGHFFEPFSLERYTSNRFVTFMERALPDQPFAPARNMGVMATDTWLDQRGTWAVGLFRTDSDVFGDDTGDEFESALTARVTYLPWYDEASDGREYVHLGFGYSLRDTNADQVRFRAQPEARLGSTTPNVPFLVDTGNVPAESYQLVGLEAAWVNGPFSVVSEYYAVPVNAAPTTTADCLFFQGAYAQTSYFLTGEHRPYRRQNGTFDRVIPRRDFLRYRGPAKDKCVEVGPGAWEVAARVSGLDLDDGPVQGGRLTDVTLGLNWYLNPYLRVTANWVRAFADRAPAGDSRTDAFGMRVGFDF